MAYKKSKEKKTPKQIMERFSYLKGDRSTWDSHWRELGIYFQPNRSDFNTTFTPGGKRNIDLLDNTGMISNELLAGFLHGNLTNPNATFFELTSGFEDLDLEDGVRKFLQDTGNRMHNIINNSNFQTEVHQYYLDLISIGTACLSCEEDDENVVRFASRHMKNIYVSENNKGRIDEIYHEFQWDIRQIVAEWGMDILKLHSMLQEKWDQNSNEKFCIVNAVYPKDVTETDSVQRYCSQYILQHDDGIEMGLEHFRELPFIVARWIKSSGEIYGRSPAMIALPDAKTLNKMTETVMIAAQKAIDPPLQAPDDTFVLPIRTRPGGINYYRAGTQDRLEPIFNNAQVDFGFEAMKERRMRIRQAFYVDQLQLDRDGPQMTATEVLRHNEDTMRLMGPMSGRQHSEFLRPLIERVFEIMSRKNLIEVDEKVVQLFEARGIDRIDVTYSSMIAKAQKMEEGNAIQRTFQAWAPLASMDQAVFDNCKVDIAARKVAKIYGFPQDALADVDEVEQIRQARAQAQQQAVQAQQQSENVKQAASIIPAAAKMVQVQQQA
jgi:hypothetical protein